MDDTNIDSNEIFEGIMKDGERLQGILIYQNDSRDRKLYNGDYYKNVPHGYGRMEWNDGGVYEGYFENDMKMV